MQYKHSEDGEKRCHCPRCGWSGTLHQTDEYTPSEGGESLQVCPKCSTETPVQPLGSPAEGMDDTCPACGVGTRLDGYGYCQACMDELPTQVG